MSGKLEQLEAFTAVAQHGGFAAAAREIRSTRAKVNRLVIALEDSLGTPLFLRTTRKVVLSEAGERYFVHCQTLLAELNAVEQSLRQEECELSGRIRISAPTSFAIGELVTPLAKFAANYPSVQLDVDFNDAFIDPVVDGIDIAIRISEAPTAKALPWLRLREVPLHLVAAPKFLDQYGPLERIDQLRDAPFAGYDNRGTAHVIRVLEGARLHSFEPRTVLHSNNGEMMRGALIEGIGCGVLPEFLARQALDQGLLQVIAPALTLPPLWLGLVFPPRDRLSRRVKVLADYLETCLGA